MSNPNSTESRSGDEPRRLVTLIDAADNLAKSNWEIGESMMTTAAESPLVPVRLWAAVLLTDAHEIPARAYLDLAARLLNDTDASVRTAAMESLVFYEARPDLLWSDVAPLIRQLL